jgi:RNA polymerase sigma-70 factor, ECF subfamily
MRWRREIPPVPAVDDDRFQDEGEPYPRHWREFPPPWPPGAATEATGGGELASALDELPTTWREVVTGSDVRHRDPRGVAADLGLEPRQERAIRNRARAVLRERLARLIARRGAP